jgi:hypothetical protein
MQTKTILRIPPDKINGERIGQLIYRAIIRDISQSGLIGKTSIEQELYHIENDRLQEIINNYITI